MVQGIGQKREVKFADRHLVIFWKYTHFNINEGDNLKAWVHSCYTCEA